MLKFGLGLGINKGRFLFNPFNLNPLLAYEAESSMVAPFERPTLDLDPSNPSSLDIITATRAGVATYTDANGVVQSADPNTVRVDHVDGVPMILVEPAATNLVDYSEDFSGVGWNYSSDALETESNSIISPMGTQTADKILKTATRNYAYAFLSQTVISGQVYTCSVFMKKGTHDLGFLSFSEGDTDYKAFYDLTGGTSGMIDGSATTSIEDVGNGWFRCSLRGISSTSDVSVRFNFGMSYSTSSENWPSANQGDGLYAYIWGAQIEAGTVATSYIPTSGSTVTRNADNLVISGSDFTDFYNSGGDGTFYAEFEARNKDDAFYILAGDTSSKRLFYSNQGSATLYSYDGANSLIFGNVQTGLNRAAISYNSTEQDGSMNGGGGAIENTTHNGNLSGLTELVIGRLGGDYYLSGHIKRIIYWPYHSDDL